MTVLESRDRLGGYTIGRYVRTGSTGQLYLGRRVAPAGFAPTVAIKVLTPKIYATAETSALLDAEQIAAARIDDPRVIKLDELGDDNGLRYIAMECVRGFSLADILAFYYERDRRIRPGLAVYIAMQVALGLQAAHESRDHKGNHPRIVHGTLTTKRVLVTWKGHVKIVRFGFAKLMADEPLSSGQELYRAPEMFDLDRVDGRADVFALGAVLLASLARGGLPVLGGVIDRSAIPGSLARAEGIPPGVGDVVAQALTPRKEDRLTALSFYRGLVDAMPEALKITPSDVARELAAIRLDREFAAFAEDRPLVGGSFVPPRMTEVPSPFATAPPSAPSEAAALAERLVVPRLPGLPRIGGSMPPRATPSSRELESTPETPAAKAAVLPSASRLAASEAASRTPDQPPAAERAPAAGPLPMPIDETPAPPPPLSSASLLPAVRVEYADSAGPARVLPVDAGSSKSALVVPPATSAPAPASSSPLLAHGVAAPVAEPSPLAPSNATRASRMTRVTLIVAVVVAFVLGMLVVAIVKR